MIDINDLDDAPQYGSAHAMRCEIDRLREENAGLKAEVSILERERDEALRDMLESEKLRGEPSHKTTSFYKGSASALVFSLLCYQGMSWCQIFERVRGRSPKDRLLWTAEFDGGTFREFPIDERTVVSARHTELAAKLLREFKNSMEVSS